MPANPLRGTRRDEVSEVKRIFLQSAVLEADAAGRGVAVKDNIDTVGTVTTYGSKIFERNVPAADALAVARLKAAGYSVVGKTNLHEFAFGVTSENPHFGTVPNPLDRDRIAGGSSGGSAAAVAAGLTPFGLGTDTAGSIRIPAACCGVTGFKPTYGLVPTRGCFPLAPSFDHVGPIARTVAGCSELMGPLALQTRPHRKKPSLKDLRVGLVEMHDVAPLVRERILEVTSYFKDAIPVELEPVGHCASVYMYEVGRVHAKLWSAKRSLYGEDVAVKIRQCLAVERAAHWQGRVTLLRYRHRLRRMLECFDVLVGPTIPCVAPPRGLGDRKLRARLTRFTLPWNCIGAPALALPCGLAEHGLPASVQLVASPGCDERVLSVGMALEEALVC